jgi:hypothetical protein
MNTLLARGRETRTLRDFAQHRGDRLRRDVGGPKQINRYEVRLAFLVPGRGGTAVKCRRTIRLFLRQQVPQLVSYRRRKFIIVHQVYQASGDEDVTCPPAKRRCDAVVQDGNSERPLHSLGRQTSKGSLRPLLSRVRDGSTLFSHPALASVGCGCATDRRGNREEHCTNDRNPVMAHAASFTTAVPIHDPGLYWGKGCSRSVPGDLKGVGVA